jgi:hypothetical protein
MEIPRLVITIEQKDKEQKVINKIRFDKDIEQEIDLIKLQPDFSDKIEELLVKLDDEGKLKYVWKEIYLKNKKIIKENE